MNAPNPKKARHQSLGIPQSWHVVRLLQTPLYVIEEYWQTLAMWDTLKFRLCDTIDPAWEDVQQMIERNGQHMYHIWDEERQTLVADFMFENFTGKAAQVHFGCHPENTTRYNLDMVADVIRDILQTWVLQNSDEPYLETVFGLTPVTNRAACIFVQKVGFKKIACIPKAMKDRGQIVDAQLSLMTRN